MCFLKRRKQKSKKKRMPTALGDYEVHKAWEGFASIRQISSGEIMHCRTSPMEEARKLYIEQSNLSERLTSRNGVAADQLPPLVIWDVGLGAAANKRADDAVHNYAPFRKSSKRQHEHDIRRETDGECGVVDEEKVVGSVRE